MADLDTCDTWIEFGFCTCWPKCIGVKTVTKNKMLEKLDEVHDLATKLMNSSETDRVEIGEQLMSIISDEPKPKPGPVHLPGRQSLLGYDANGTYTDTYDK